MKSTTTFKPNPINELALQHAGDMPVKAICTKYGISEKQLRAAARYRGISLAYGKPATLKKPWTDADLRQLKVLSVTHTSAAIAQQLGRTELSVKGKAYSLGIHFMKVGENNPLAKHSNHDIELCRQLGEAGLRPYQIAEKMEIELSHVCRVLKFEARYKELGARV
ncbi:hypothetical protein HRJ35_16560 [Shewanella oneidensis MR-1]|uniref:Lambda phage uncharacterized protein n=1 Tax=Shewanella oneidensis (strain ATCC 700550 / JCM 31522 / CIP 106686 / LMG 19005 / NCIMB 14063 / MR-1) TaxID=211586 RepID=Q8ECW7_SHEON|nr:phage protein [Shewanella oneidensis]AAN56017.1 Lambda phage uncharacterized protein [Shewanella oneidensis MR-1]MDX5999546.1 hypothetical protein [Shewanella oneidensis]MEE2027412.1 hypothetical protein [Shewanella oneidensis]QKG97460.1 hypothetical protein HRJ35_16560 [Shewanella oneidensis MR-1]